MEGSRGRDGRQIRRCHEATRLEEELWALAYDQISPSVPRAVKRLQPVRLPAPRILPTLRTPIANVKRMR
jgi:hypothetical protein